MSLVVFRYFSVNNPSCEHDCEAEEEETDPTSGGNFLITETENKFLLTESGDFLITE